MGKNYLRRGKILNIFICVLAVLALLPFILGLILRIPAVQDYVLGKVTTAVSQKINSRVSVKRIHLSLLKSLRLQEVYIEDKAKDTLLYAHELEVDVNILPLLKQQISVRNVRLYNAYANIYRNSGQSDFNYTFIVKAFQDTVNTDTSSSSWKFELHEINLRQLKLRYKDIPGGSSFNTSLASLDAEFNTLGLDSQHTQLDKAEIKGLLLAMDLTRPEQVSTPATDTTQGAASAPWKVSVNNLSVQSSEIAYNDYKNKALDKGMDFNRLKISELNGTLENISIAGADIAMVVNKLSLKERSGFRLFALEGKLDMKASDIGVELARLETPNSRLAHSLQLTVPLQTSMPEMAVNGRFRNDVISVKDIRYFMPELDTLEALRNKSITISGDLDGKLKDFIFRDLTIALDGQTRLKGHIAAKGLPDIKKAYLDLNIKSLDVNAGLIASFVHDKSTRERILPFGQIRMSGIIKGHTTSPAVKISAATGAGNISADVKLNLDTSFTPQAFAGNIASQDFDLGKILGKESGLGKITMNASANGKGQDIQQFSALVSSAEYNNYNYRNVKVEGSMLQNIVQARIISDDINLKTNLQVAANLKTSYYKASGIVSKANLQALHFMTTPLLTGARIYAAVYAPHPDSLRGTVKLRNVSLSSKTGSYKADSVVLLADLKNSVHTFTLQSPFAQGYVSGHFSLQELPVFFTRIAENYQGNTATAAPPEHTESLDIDIQSGNLSELVKIFVPDLTTLDRVSIKGRYRKQEQQLELNTHVNDIVFGAYQMHELTVEAAGRGDQLKFSTQANSLNSGQNISISKIFLTGSMSQNKARFNLKLYDHAAPTHLNLDGTLAYTHDTLRLHFPSGEIFIKGKQWNFSNGNSIVYGKDYLQVNDLVLSQGPQRIVVNSQMRGKANSANAVFENVNLNELAEIAGAASYGMKGVLNGRIEGRDLFASQQMNGELRIDSFALNNTGMGTITISANKPGRQDMINLLLTLDGGENNKAEVHGYYSLAKNNPLDFDIRIFKLGLHPFEPLTKDFAYKLNGNVSGFFKLTGTASAPMFMGNLTFAGQNQIGLTATHTTYSVNEQQITFHESSIELNKFTMKDSLAHEAVASGFIYHKNFKNFRFDLHFATDNFQLVNSGYTADAPVYGQLFARLNVGVTGPLENLTISLDAMTRKGTKLFVPIAAAQASSMLPSYVRFNEIEPVGAPGIKKPGEKRDSSQVPMYPKLNLSRYTVRGQVRVTKDAELDIIVDPVNGDKISAKGNGAFSLAFDSQNDMNIYGTYAIDSGSYSFSFVNLVKKNFKIKKGSTISWAGDPQNAELNITAIYETRASRYELVEDQTYFMSRDQINAAKRPLPVEVYLTITGEMQSPEISFDIRVPEGADPLNGNLVVQKISQIKSDPNELNKQVFSLIVMNKFMTENGSSTSASGSDVAFNQLNESVSRVLNTQLNRLSEDYLRGVDINVNLQALDQSYGVLAQNAQISASKQISSRITVSAGGNVNINSSYGSGQFAGDYNVYYRLNSNGSVNLKFFRTSTQTIYTNNLYTVSGFSINYRREFNRWRNLFRSPMRRERERGEKGRENEAM